jgi:hypothetical protein
MNSLVFQLRPPEERGILVTGWEQCFLTKPDFLFKPRVSYYYYYVRARIPKLKGTSWVGNTRLLAAFEYSFVQYRVRKKKVPTPTPAPPSPLPSPLTINLTSHHYLITYITDWKHYFIEQRRLGEHCSTNMRCICMVDTEQLKSVLGWSWVAIPMEELHISFWYL